MRKVIYTVLTGGYDRLEQPAALDPSFDYVCFTDIPAPGRDGVWELRPIPFEGSSVLRARWVKMHPHLLLPEYDCSVFMDANLQIASPEFYEKVPAEPAVLGALPHPQRDCVWEELRYCYLKDKMGTCAAVKWHRALRQMQMPRHAGLYETNVLLRAHNHPPMVALDEAWWTLLLRSGASRDQLCFTPALRQCGLQPALLFGPGLHARNVPYIRYSVHPVTGRENVPGRLNWANLKYNLRLLWRKSVLLWLK